MAEAVISIGGSILANLITQALEKVGNIAGVERELQELGSTVSMLRAVLDHAEQQYHQSPEIKDWVGKLKEAFYEAQDVLEEFNIEAMRRELRGDDKMIKGVRTFFSSSNQLTFAPKMRRKVTALRKRMQVLEAEKKFHLDERSVDSRTEIQWRETHSFIREEGIIGREDNKKKVREFLLDLDVKEDVSILPIVGIGGLGKTALAQYVYNDEMVSRHFNLKMWVCVSNYFDLKKIVKNIIVCAKGEEPKDGTLEQLQSELRKEIDGKRYFLVLDDLWNEKQDSWLELTNLVGGARGSKILITTRLHKVADIIGTAPPHLLSGLSENASLDLLLRMAHREKEEMQDLGMLDIAKEIVEKCSGVPLVVRTVGSLLFFKKTKLEWLRFKDDELPQVSQSEEDINSVLKLSYDHLPSHLKQCFAFCSLFPKDYVIKKQTLVDLWMAEGFIQPSNGHQHLEDIAHEYFMELLWSNFFQDFKEKVQDFREEYLKEDETCKMHDLIHDLACSVAGMECWVAWVDKKPIHKKTRHISNDFTSNLMGKLPISCLKASALRTYLCATKYKKMRQEPNLPELIQNFKRLRILDLHDTNVEKVPRSICKLKHLTYLDLSCNEALKRLPNCITRLQNLQTLKLNNCYHLEELPRDIRKLVSLRNLDIDGCYALSYMPRGLGQLGSLHRLMKFILPKDKALIKNCGGLEELNGLNNIRGKLRIDNLGSVTNAVVESKAANLREKRFLEFLNLSWCYLDVDDAITKKRDEALLDGLRPHKNLQGLTIFRYNGESFPSWMADMPDLVTLRLLGCRRCKHLPQFGLNKLKRLEINGMKFLEYVPEECLKSLSSLESLDICDFPRLTSLTLGLRHLSKLVDLSLWSCGELDLSKDENGNIISDLHGGLQNLRFLGISDLPKLESLPQWLLQARNLERLRISNCCNLKAMTEQIEALRSLQWLDIQYCHSLASLPEGMGRLASLTHLYIETCKELNLSKDERGDILDFHGGLQSLRFIRIMNLPKVESLPPWLLQLSNLEHLEISQCSNLKALPEQMEALQSLQELEIMGCPLLTSLPEGMRRLTSLTFLYISNCPELDKRCERDAIPRPIEHLPEFLKWNYYGSSIGQAQEEDREVILLLAFDSNIV
ncbi:hypothetical protein BT93_B0857 [Corymbia citriodora subsp. variegata]|nr:hypothetical protein BT93_B0857 [Corymbia citriodora subsp. variegata]